MDKFIDKAEGALDKFMSDPEKVEKAKDKAEGLLGKHMDKGSAEKITDAAESMLEKFSHHDHPTEH